MCCGAWLMLRRMAHVAAHGSCCGAWLMLRRCAWFMPRHECDMSAAGATSMPTHIGNPPSRRRHSITNMHALAASASACMGRCGLALVVDQYVRSAPEADQLIRLESSILALRGPASGRAKHFFAAGSQGKRAFELWLKRKPLPRLPRNEVYRLRISQRLIRPARERYLR